jgi:hypothetical protein
MISTAMTGNGTPTSSSVSPIVPADIRRTSQAAAMMQPPASACPLTAATTGRGWSNTARNIALSAGRYAWSMRTTATGSCSSTAITCLPPIADDCVDRPADDGTAATV